MCRTVHAVLSTIICGVQMLVRVFMTIILMVENLIRMILQTSYNFLSFMMQLMSLIPICVIFLVTTRLKCFMCGGGGPCPVNRGGACDCLMSILAVVILFFIFRAVGVLDKMFYKLGYVEAPPPIAIARFIPTPGDITECSRDDKTTTEKTTTEKTTTTTATMIIDSTLTLPEYAYDGTYNLRFGQDITETIIMLSTTEEGYTVTPILELPPQATDILARVLENIEELPLEEKDNDKEVQPKMRPQITLDKRKQASTAMKPRKLTNRNLMDIMSSRDLTTILYYIV